MWVFEFVFEFDLALELALDLAGAPRSRRVFCGDNVGSNTFPS
jgi:hypothetical protein